MVLDFATVLRDPLNFLKKEVFKFEIFLPQS